MKSVSRGLRAAVILHIATEADWTAARTTGRYEPPSLAAEGFIHFSTPEQVVTTANRFFAGRQDLVLLTVDPELLAAELRYERPDDLDELFPHVYGPVELEAVVRVRPFRPGPDGRFEHIP